MKIAIMGPIFVKVALSGIAFTSEPLELAKKLAEKHTVSFITSISNTSVKYQIQDEVAKHNINTEHIRVHDHGTGFYIDSSIGQYDDIIQYPSLDGCATYIERHASRVFSGIDAFIIGSEHYELIHSCEDYNVTPYLYVPPQFLEYLDDDEEEMLEGIVRLTDKNISDYF